MSSLNIRIVTKEIALRFFTSVIFFDGIIEKQQVPYIESQISPVLSKKLPVIFNMSGVTYLNSNALELFVDIGENAEKYGIQHIMSNLHPQIYTLLCNMGINFLFSIYLTEEEALKKAKDQQLLDTKRRDKLEPMPHSTGVLSCLAEDSDDVQPLEPVALSQKDKDFIAKIQKLIKGKALELPVLPGTALRLMDLSGNPSSSIEDLEKEIGKDPSLASALLKIANSCVYGGVMPVDSIKSGIVRLGRKRLRAMIMGLTLGSKIIKGKKIDIIARNLWIHSLASAYMTSSIAKFLKIEDSVAFSAALLHDLHKAILLPVCRDALKDVLDYFPTMPVLEMVYQEHFEAIVKEIQEKWNFPPSFTNILLHQKNFSQAQEGEERQNAALVFLGNQFIKAIEKKAIPWKLEKATEYLHIKKEQIPIFIQNSENIYKEVVKNTV